MRPAKPSARLPIRTVIPSAVPSRACALRAREGPRFVRFPRNAIYLPLRVRAAFREACRRPCFPRLAADFLA